MKADKLARIENIKTLGAEGLTYREIAKILECAVSTVCRYLGEGQIEKSRERGRKTYIAKPKPIKEPLDPETVKAAAKQRMLLHRYNLSQEEYERLYDLQGGKCAICEDPRKLGSYNGLYVDHDHSTGKVRGLLCPSCNTALGNFKDSPRLLQKAIDYCSR